jgi:hypothetical protein
VEFYLVVCDGAAALGIPVGLAVDAPEMALRCVATSTVQTLDHRLREVPISDRLVRAD